MNYSLGEPEQLAEHAGITVEELWKEEESLSALGLTAMTELGGPIEITVLGMHVLEPANPLYGGDGSLEDVPSRERVVLNILAKHWPGEVPQPEIFEDSGLSMEEFDDALWGLTQIGFTESTACGWEAEIMITKKGYALFQEHNPAFEDVRPTAGDKVKVYGNMNQSAVTTGKGTASVIN